MGRKASKQEIEQRILEAHGDKYTVLGDTNGMSQKVSLSCKICKYTWSAKPSDVTRKGKPSGCPKCAGSIKLTTKEVNARIAPDYILAEESKGVNTKTKVTHLVCGNTWEVIPYDISTKKSSCPTCSTVKVRTLEETKELLMETRRGEYTIIGTYTGVTNKTTVVHNLCGNTWDVRLINLIKGISSCPTCSRERIKDILRKPVEVYKEELSLLEKGPFVLVGEYTNSNTSTMHKHTVCGTEWIVAPRDLLSNSSGCPSCAKYGFNPHKPGVLYFLKVRHEGSVYYKVGITNRSVEERYQNKDLEKIEVLWLQHFELGVEAKNAEKEILEEYKRYRVKNVKALASGNTELLSIELDKDYNIVGE